MLGLYALKVLYIENVRRQNAINQSILIVQYIHPRSVDEIFNIYISSKSGN